MIANTTKQCSRCGEERPLDQFYVAKRNPRTGSVIRKSHCKECVRKRTAKHKRKHRGEYRTLAAIQAEAAAKRTCECGGVKDSKASRCGRCVNQHSQKGNVWIEGAWQLIRRRRHYARKTDWHRRVDSTCSSLFLRRNRLPKHSGSASRKQLKGWSECIKKQTQAIKGRRRRADPRVPDHLAHRRPGPGPTRRPLLHRPPARARAAVT